MTDLQVKFPSKVESILLRQDGSIPNNSRFPVLLYCNVFDPNTISTDEIQVLLKKHSWEKSWVDSIYDYHHYHSNTHEVLVMCAGEVHVQLGGPHGQIHYLRSGDVVIIPAGVAHKSTSMSDDFQCVGAYSLNVNYDMNRGTEVELAKSVANIQIVGLPLQDPVFGKDGLVFQYWQ